MAELILTEAEKRTINFLDWDDATLGKAVKKAAMIIGDTEGRDALTVTAAAVFLVAEAVRSGSTKTTIELKGAWQGDVALGDWVITLEEHY